MKEAAGEANLTVITIILIGIIVAVATPIINTMMQNTARRACCQSAGGVWQGGDGCVQIGSDGNPTGVALTNYWDEDNNTCGI